jgi:hypothetical protein
MRSFGTVSQNIDLERVVIDIVTNITGPTQANHGQQVKATNPPYPDS